MSLSIQIGDKVSVNYQNDPTDSLSQFAPAKEKGIVTDIKRDEETNELMFDVWPEHNIEIMKTGVLKEIPAMMIGEI